MAGKKKQSDVIHVKSKSKKGFWRAGIKFGPEYQEVKSDGLSPEQQDILEAELQAENSKLICRELEEARAKKAEEAKKKSSGDK